MSLSLLDEYDAHVGAKLRALREELNLSADGVAEALETSRQQLYRYERGKNRIPISRIICAAQLFGVELCYFDPVNGSCSGSDLEIETEAGSATTCGGAHH